MARSLIQLVETVGSRQERHITDHALLHGKSFEARRAAPAEMQSPDIGAMIFSQHNEPLQCGKRHAMTALDDAREPRISRLFSTSAVGHVKRRNAVWKALDRRETLFWRLPGSVRTAQRLWFTRALPRQSSGWGARETLNVAVPLPLSPVSIEQVQIHPQNAAPNVSELRSIAIPVALGSPPSPLDATAYWHCCAREPGSSRATAPWG